MIGPSNPGPGHNSGAPEIPSEVGGIAAQKLRAFVEKIERLEAEKTDLTTDIREVFAEAKGNGFDTKIMRQIIKLRGMEEPDRKEQDELLDLYRQALGI
jgi:uncharacterized protein (UPF0335 family)